MKKLILLLLIVSTSAILAQETSYYKLYSTELSQYENGYWVDYGVSDYSQRNIKLYINYNTGEIWLNAYSNKYQLKRKIKDVYYITDSDSSLYTCFDYTATNKDGENCKIILEYSKKFIRVSVCSEYKIIKFVALTN